MLVKVIHRLWTISLIAEPQHGTLQGVVGAASRAHPAPACIPSMSMRPGLPPARGLTKEVTYDPGPKTCARPGLRRHIPEGPQPAGRVQRGPSLTLSDPAPARGQGAPALTWRTAACPARSAWLRSPWTAGRRRAARCRSPARARSCTRPTTPGAAPRICSPTGTCSCQGLAERQSSPEYVRQLDAGFVPGRAEAMYVTMCVACCLARLRRPTAPDLSVVRGC